MRAVVEVSGGGVEADVAHCGLDGFEVGSGLEGVGCPCVAEDVRGNDAIHSDLGGSEFAGSLDVGFVHVPPDDAVVVAGVFAWGF